MAAQPEEDGNGGGGGGEDNSHGDESGGKDDEDSGGKKHPTLRAKTCNDCNRQLCLSYNLPQCRTVREEEVFTQCFREYNTPVEFPFLSDFACASFKDNQRNAWKLNTVYSRTEIILKKTMLTKVLDLNRARFCQR